MGTSPKIKPARTGGLAGYPKSAGLGFKVGNIAYFEKAPDSRWLLCDGSFVTNTAYPELAKVLGPVKPPILQQLAVSGTLPTTVFSGAKSAAFTADGVYLACPKDNNSPANILLYQNINDTLVYQNTVATANTVNVITEMAWSPDTTKLVVIFSGNTGIYVYTRTGTVLTYAGASSTSLQPSNINWIDNDLFVVTTSSNPAITIFTVSGAGVPASVTSVGPATTPLLEVTAGKLLVAITTTNCYIYQRSGNSLVQINTFALVNSIVLSALAQFAVAGEADTVVVNQNSSLAIYTKNQTTGAYTYSKPLSTQITNVAYDINIDTNREFLYQWTTGANTTHAVYSIAGNSLLPLYTEADIIYTGATPTVRSATLNASNKYVYWNTSTAPYFAVFKELTTFKVVLPLATSRYKLGRRLYPFIKAKS